MMNIPIGEKEFFGKLTQITKDKLSDEHFGVSELAGEMGMSRYNLHRRIKSVTGKSASQFIREVRLTKALELLKESSFTVSEVAFGVGFGSTTYFSRCFHNHYGCSPGKARKLTPEEAGPKDHIPDQPGEEYTSRINNLPVQTTSFIGREKEIKTITGLITEYRIVSLVGTGGCGKTRLACEVVAQLVQNYNDDIWFVDLAPVETGDLVVKQVMETLGIPETPGHDWMDSLLDNIRDKKLLILLDNCEHLLRTCAEVTGKLIHSVNGLHVVTTSREILNIKGEKVWRIPPLTLIDPETIIDADHSRSSEAVRLFTDRARLINPGFELVNENARDVANICYQVDGIPLAVELVASRTRYMDPRMIQERDRFDQLSSRDPGISKRQQTLQATIEWSYNLLSDSEKLLFARLSVFSGGFDLAAAEEVCSDDQLQKETILNVLALLIDRSLVYTVKKDNQPMRYNILSTLKQFAQQVLRDRDQELIMKKRHIQYFLTIAEEAYQEQFESQLKWLSILQSDNDNLLAALDWSEKHSPEEFGRLSGSLSWFWVFKSKYILGKQYLEKAFSKEYSKSEIHARVSTGLGWILAFFNEWDRATSLYEESLNTWRGLNNLQEQAFLLAGLGELHRDKIHDFATGIKYSEQALEIARKIGKPGLINRCLLSVCQSLVHSKQFERGVPYVEELVDASEKLEQPYGIMNARHLYSDCALGMRDYNVAEKRYGFGIETALKYGNVFLAFVDMQGVAFALSGQSRWAKCLRLNAASIEKAGSLGVPVYGMIDFWDEWIDFYIEGAKKAAGKVLALKYEEEGIALGFEKAVEYALDFDTD